MSITRKSLADTIDAFDDEIATLQESKRETYAEYRADLSERMGKDEVRAEIEATKAAIKRRRAVREKGEETVEHKDALTDKIFAEIVGTVVATHVARGARASREERARLRLSESMDDNKALSEEMLRDGLITPEQHAENVALSDAVARKLGAGVVDPTTGEIIESAAADDGEGGGDDAPASLAEPIRQDEPVDAVVGGTQPAGDRRNSEPGHGHVGEMPTMATRQGGEESGMLDSLSARAVVPGGVHIPHHGSVNQ